MAVAAPGPLPPDGGGGPGGGHGPRLPRLVVDVLPGVQLRLRAPVYFKGLNLEIWKNQFVELHSCWVGQ